MVYKQWNFVVLIVILIFYGIGNSVAENLTATGTVFLDANGNQVKDEQREGVVWGSRL